MHTVKNDTNQVTTNRVFATYVRNLMQDTNNQLNE